VTLTITWLVKRAPIKALLRVTQGVRKTEKKDFGRAN
jgi:hypothetical protein